MRKIFSITALLVLSMFLTGAVIKESKQGESIDFYTNESGTVTKKAELKASGEFHVDTINEHSPGVGVTVDGTLKADTIKSKTGASIPVVISSDTAEASLKLDSSGSSAARLNLEAGTGGSAIIDASTTGGGSGTLLLRTAGNTRMSIDSSGLATFSNGINLGGSTLNTYVSKTLLGGSAVTWTANNSSANTTANIHYAKIGNLVHVEIQSFTITTNASDTFITSGTALPSGFRPSQRLMFPVSIRSSNYDYTWGVLNIDTSGKIYLYATISNNFWGAGTSGITNAISVSFLIN